MPRFTLSFPLQGAPTEEVDEFLLFEHSGGAIDSEDLPRRRLEDWSLYDDQLRLTSLEMVPMEPHVQSDVLVFGSGLMTDDDGAGFSLDEDDASGQKMNPKPSSGEGSSGAGSSSSALAENGGKHAEGPAEEEAAGIRVYLSAVREWMVEFGAGMLFVSLRTDGAWYRLGRPASSYMPWYRPVLRAAKMAVQAITLLSAETRVARLSFRDVVNKLVAEVRERSALNPMMGTRHFVECRSERNTAYKLQAEALVETLPLHALLFKPSPCPVLS